MHFVWLLVYFPKRRPIPAANINACIENTSFQFIPMKFQSLVPISTSSIMPTDKLYKKTTFLFFMAGADCGLLNKSHPLEHNVSISF